MIGIYKITNLINHKVYIGQSINIEERWRRHKSSKKRYPLYQAFKKYGIQNFTFEVVEECTPDELNDKELYYIHKYNSHKTGYNQTLDRDIYGHSTIFTGKKLDALYKDLQDMTLTQEDLAVKYNCSKRTIRDINNGKTCRKEGVSYPIRSF